MQPVEQFLRPFHETIVVMIGKCNPSPSQGEILLLMQLITITKIPHGHNEIIAAIDKYFDFPGASKFAKVIRLTKESLEAQKTAAKKEKDEHADRAYDDSLKHGGR